jgi:hypothetical protein
MPPVVARKLMSDRSNRGQRRPGPSRRYRTDLEAIGTPAPVLLSRCEATVMTILDRIGLAIEQQAIDLHHRVESLC